MLLVCYWKIGKLHNKREPLNLPISRLIRIGTAGYSGSPLSNTDVLIEIDTASLVTAGKLQSDCNDLRVTDDDMTTPLDYWIEGGCNTGSTQVWARVPSMPDGGLSLYVYYGNPTASNQ